MASLQITFGDLRAEVQRYMGFGRSTNYDSLTTGQQGDVVACIERGLRQFYAPAPLPNESSAHEWSFLRGMGVVSTRAPYTVGTATNSAGAAVVAIIDGVMQTVYEGQIITLAGETRRILDVAGQNLTVDASIASANTTVAYEILSGTYDLPADFGGLRGSISYRDGDGYMPLRLVNESALAMMRSQESIRKDTPEYAAIVPKSTTDNSVDNDSTGEQQFVLSIWPYLDKVYDLVFSYTVAINNITDNPASNADDNNIPAGGMFHSETILASCLAVAEQMVDEFNNPGKMQAKYQERLAGSISFDRRQMLPDGFGYNADNSDRQTQLPSRRRLQTVSYRDSIYP